LDGHGAYDMIFYAAQFYSNDVDWLAYEYWSEYADIPYQNPTNFRNATYDACRQQLLYSTTIEDIRNASSWMQKILHYNVPRLVVYENTYNQAYRIDEYTGYVEDLGRYISGPWSMRKVHKIDGNPGGTFALAISSEPDTFNIFSTNSASSAAILSNLWSSLYRYGPDLNPYPDLAESMIIETHTNNAAVPIGYTRFTVDIIQNATWSDGVPLTAEDVAFTMIYAYESYAYGNPAGAYLGDLVAAYAPTTYRAIIEFSTESYWHFSSFAYDYIIPKHIFNDTDGIGYAGWNTWNPFLDPSEPNVTCGPFVFTDFEAGEFYEISRNPLFHYRDTEIPTTTSPPTTTTTTTISSPPIILSESGTSYVEGTTGNQILWEVYDDNPLLFQLFIDGELNDTSLWDGSNIVVNVDSLSVGTHNYTLVLYDYDLNCVSSTVFVTVLPYTMTTTDTTTTDTTSTTSPTSTTSTTSTGSTTSGTTENVGNILGNLPIVISIGSALVIIFVVAIIVKQR
jgi:ABC-type transport system substrate-binding protein